jgi:polysaccharide export outer membrane protein
MSYRYLLLTLFVSVFTCVAEAQQTVVPIAAALPAAASQPGTAAVLPPNSGELSLDYVLGPDDAVSIHAYEMENEIPDRPVVVERDGTLQLAVLGKVKAEGLTVQQLEEAIAEKLKRYVRQPRVSISIVHFRSEPIFVEGAFKAPGIYQLQQHKTLLDLITAVGVQPDVSHKVRVTRRLEYGALPLTSTVQQPGSKTTSAEIDMSAIKDGTNPVGNIDLKPYDVVSAKQAERIYVLGDVTKAGPLELGEHETLSVLQVLSLSGGATADASLANALVLRPSPDNNRKTQIPVNLKRILATSDEDIALRPNDILYVPPKSGAGPVIEKMAYIAMPMIPAFLYLFLH